MLRIIPFAHLSLKEFVRPDSIVIDMTCGNGFDTKFLTTLPAKKILSFDIQKQAIDKAKTLTTDERIQFVHDSHVNVAKYTDVFDAAIFNLGYLPGSDKSITTSGESTITAIEQLIEIARRPSLIVIVVYPGHTEGKNESKQLENYIHTLKDGFVVSKYTMLHKLDAPYVITIEIKNKWTC